MKEDKLRRKKIKAEKQKSIEKNKGRKKENKEKEKWKKTTWTWTSLNPPVSRRKTHPLHVRYAGDSKGLSWQNRPIVLLRPGHEVRGIPAVRSCKKRCFLYFYEALSWPRMALNDCFFFQLAWKTQSMCDDVLLRRWIRKKSGLERLSPLPESTSPVSRNRSGSVCWAPQGRHSRGTIYLTLEEKCY